ncbi:MAG: hypothetical protein R3F61_29880 [Myxococcota bacterium]
MRTCACGTVLFDAPTCPTCGAGGSRTSSALLVLLGLAACAGPRPAETVSDLYGAPPTEEVDEPVAPAPSAENISDIYGAPPTDDLEPGPLDVAIEEAGTPKKPADPKKPPTPLD